MEIWGLSINDSAKEHLVHYKAELAKQKKNLHRFIVLMPRYDGNGQSYIIGTSYSAIVIFRFLI